jgi:hypothetical protein
VNEKILSSRHETLANRAANTILEEVDELYPKAQRFIEEID